MNSKPFFLIFLLLLCSCSSIPFLGDDFELTTSSTKRKSLEVPPDLISPAKDRKFSIPASGSSSMSAFQASTEEEKISQPSSFILPDVDGVKIKFYGNYRVLIVDKPAQILWPKLRNFWLKAGFTIVREEPGVGLIETDWFEDKRRAPNDFIRDMIGKVFQNVYDTGERDKYIMRLERVGDNQTEISVAHKGLMQIVGDRPDSTVSWVNKPNDRKLEDDYLKRIMISLGLAEKSTELLAMKEGVSDQSRLFLEDNNSFIELNEKFALAWRKVGIAIDRLAFSVEDKNRDNGTYILKYNDPTIESEKESFFSKIFSFGKKKVKINKYQIVVMSVDEGTRVFVTDEGGNKNTPITNSITKILFEQIK